ncbi:MAG: BREX system P-loop protein BrxC [Oscillospiraceae bacterium]|nr:BREX system P-loop protein BrxC [Oscillospiraceae bacterium]
MKISQLFEKDINRTIKGVVKVEQDATEDVKQELEEYVVTKELNKHFTTFFSNYKKGITGNTDAMGVWISGFFGSGKSHFLKMLSYILDGKSYGGKTALQYFEDDNKIQDSMVMADMKLAAETSTDVILYNIDSRSEMTGKSNKEAIGYVFLKVFNEMQGFCGAIPLVADLERRLTEENRYDEFKEKFEEINGSSWVESRDDFDYIQDEVVEVLVDMGVMTEEAARNICEKIAEPYSIDVKKFAELVKKYIDKKPKNHHVVFLVDEIGQYIGDNNDLMLNLQTVTENLGTACRGKVWVIVTSQQDIDSVTKTNQNFSKIQGRFDTRLSLSSANADEVIKKRILKKNDTGSETLRVLFDEKDTGIKNIIDFRECAEMKLYSDREDFAEVYPFIPYHFNLLSRILTAVRTYSTSLKHLSDGERSMLAIFKESAVRLSENEPGRVIPLYMFYDALERYLDHTYSSVITKAWGNDHINPDKEENCFAVNVLKTLLLIKYVNEVKSYPENIASLMVEHLDEERMGLQKKVEAALNVLVNQMLVQKNGENYVFLTNEEQEINKSISQQPVEPTEITAEISSLIFQGIYSEDKYRCNHLNGRYNFRFNQVVDDKMLRTNQNHDITVKFITPAGDESRDDATLRISSTQDRAVLVVLPDDRSFIDEIIRAKQIEKFLMTGSASVVNFELIKIQKQTELRQRKENSKIYLEEALSHAVIYANGEPVATNAKEIGSRINEALGKLVSTIYHKLAYIDTPTNENDILNVITSKDTQMIIAGTQSLPNKLALNDMLEYIGRNTDKHTKTSMKTLTERFIKAPYGFVEADIQWLVAKLFKNGDIFMFINSENISLNNKDPKEIVRYLIRKEYIDKLMTDRREKVSEKKKKDVKDIIKNVFGVAYSNDDEDAIMRDFRRYAKDCDEELAKIEMRYSSNRYPGKDIVTGGRKYMREVLGYEFTQEFYNDVPKMLDDLLDFAEDYEPVKKFFAGEQVRIFDESIKILHTFDAGKSYIVDDNIESIAKQIREIVKNPKPYGNIHKLTGFIDEFRTAYVALLDERAEPVRTAVKEARDRVFEVLDGKLCKDKLVDKFIKIFDELREKVESCHNIPELRGIIDEADTLKIRCINDIDALEAKIIAEQTPPAPNPTVTPATAGQGTGETAPTVHEPPKPVVKKRKNISIKTINTSLSWQLESEADVKRYVSELEKKLMQALEEDTVINIEF